MLLIFDFDGVCRDESASYERCIRETVGFFDPEKKGATKEELQVSMENSNDDWSRTQMILESRGIQKKFLEIQEHFQNLYLGKKRDFSGYIHNEPWLADNEQFQKLSGKYFLTIVSGAPREEIEYTLKKNNAEKYFSLILGMNECEEKADGIQKVMTHFVEEKAYFCDDRPSPLRQAKTVPNVSAFGILPPQELENWKEVLENAGAERVFGSVREYCDFILNE